MPAAQLSPRSARRGFVIGELLVAVLLLAVAVSSLAALMYSVSHRTTEPEKTECVAKASKTGCASPAPVAGSAKLLRSPNRSTCEGLSGAAQRDCVDAAIARKDGETLVVARTDSASLALIPKKTKKTIRTDRGFIR